MQYYAKGSLNEILELDYNYPYKTTKELNSIDFFYLFSDMITALNESIKKNINYNNLTPESIFADND